LLHGCIDRLLEIDPVFTWCGLSTLLILVGSTLRENKSYSGMCMLPFKVRQSSVRNLRGGPRRRQHRSCAGYTLLELLVVMGIIALLTAVATPQVMGYFGKAKTQSVQLQIENINTALEMYYMDNGVYPRPAEGLKALVEAPSDTPRWNGPYLTKAKSLIDPWGRPYQYVVRESGFEVYSLGSSGKARSANAGLGQTFAGS
jgi:general secretion pathway protein G